MAHARRQYAALLGRSRGEQLAAAIRQWALHPVADTAVLQLPKAIQRQRSPRSIAAKALETLAIIGVQVNAGMEREALGERRAPSPAGHVEERHWQGLNRQGIADIHRIETISGLGLVRAQQALETAGDPEQHRLHVLLAECAGSEERTVAQENPVWDYAVEMDIEVEVERTAKALHERHGSTAAGVGPAAVLREDCPQRQGQRPARELRIASEQPGPSAAGTAPIAGPELGG